MPDSTKISAKRNIIEFNIDSIQEDEHIAWIGGEFVPTTVTSGGGISTTINTRANILALPTTSGSLAYATDVERLYIADGTSWFESAVQFTANAQAPNMGAEQNGSLQGYGSDYISDKALSFITLGEGADDVKGAMRLVSGTFQIYANGVWNDVVINFRLREDSDGAFEFEHKPIGFLEWIEINSGNSDTIGIDGRPIIQQYTTSMGAEQLDLVIDGGTF